MALDLGQVAQLLHATLDSRQHKQAEVALKQEENKPNFSLLLLQIVSTEDFPLNTRLAGALCFKNFIKFNWEEDGTYKLQQNEVVTIKSQLIGLMTSVPSSIQAQLGESISVIADSDFWTRWETLVDDLVSRLTPDNPKVNLGVLEVAHSIFKRWRPLFASDELYTEINHVLFRFGEPFVQLLASTDQQIEANKNNKDVLKQYVEVLNLLVKLFYDLSCQDLPPIFEENLAHVTALHFLTAVASIGTHAQNFNNPEILGQVVEKVILPNVSLRESDIEQFEDEPIEYIRRDLEGSDTDTRRRAATDFLRKLLDKFENLVTDVVGQYIKHYLDAFKHNSSEWKSKDTAIYLFSAIAAKGAATTSQGIKTTNSLVNVLSFFEENIAGDLLKSDGVEPIIKVDAIKYLYTFRRQLTKSQWTAAFPPLVQNLGSPNYVVYTYAAIAVERVLFLTDDSGQHVFGRSDVQPLAKDLLSHLFQLIEADPAPEKLQENEFLMRCIMRVLIVIKDGVVDFADTILAHLIHITDIVAKNPSNPRFYYYHFEALGALTFRKHSLRGCSRVHASRPHGNLSEYYQHLAQSVLVPATWENKGSVPALARLLTSIIPRGAEGIVQNNQVEPILGIFQKLMTKKSTEIYAFDILEALLTSLPASGIEQYFPTVLTIIFTRLNSNPPEKFKQRFVRFYHLVASHDEDGLGADFFIRNCDTVQDGVFVPIYLTIVLPTTQQLARPLDRKLAVVGLTKTLADSQAFAVKYQKGWGKTCEALLKLLENPPMPVTSDDNVVEVDVDDLSFGVGFTPLNTCKKQPRDDWPDVTDVKQWAGSYLKKADERHSGAIAGYVNTRLSEEAKNVLLSYMS
ncbi:putative Importin-alpha re-exporter [Glarea lozoyensis 74030]|uniref:Putative Importin-alpha re-exporter n=1 Tax=Glarea lozoyensis (strain ATCC 74030 / MF5533) TaxID=1104152 RepID=H0EPH8_GLAL7|nr:putative Importin-alpha re-exporter [Glarea lozoyensis 74030]